MRGRTWLRPLFLILFLCASSLTSDFLFAQRLVTQEERACHLLEQGKVEKAIALLDNELKINPDNLNAQLYMAIAQYLKKDKEGAFKKFEKIEKEVDRMTGASRPFGDLEMFTQMGMERKAELLFSKERRGLLYFCLGLTLREKKDFKNAEKKFKQALKQKYDERATRLQLFDVSIKLKDLKSASRHLSELKKTAEEDVVLAFLEGYLKYRGGNMDEAVAVFGRIASTCLDAKKNLALLYYNRGDYPKAIEIWEEILVEHPEDKGSQINIGRSYFHLGDSEKAEEYFTRAGVKIAPERYSPKKVPLIYEIVLKEVKFDLMCRAK
ncbi:MAG: tetratricopeptide repeat protein [Candidatus Aminicenantales bacterium]